MRILLLGGSKSGKSMLGQRLARQLADGGPMIYWATLEPRDGEDRAIVRRHLAEREGWGFQTLERGRELPRGLAAVPPESAVLFDSVTACLACQMFSGPSPDAAAPERTAEELAGRQPARPAPGVRVRRDLAGRRDLRDLDRDVSPGPGGGVPGPGGGI